MKAESGRGNGERQGKLSRKDVGRSRGGAGSESAKMRQGVRLWPVPSVTKGSVSTFSTFLQSDARPTEVN